MKQKKKPNAELLYAAIRRRDLKMLQKLLSEGVDPNAAVHDDYHGDNPVLLCAAGGQFIEGVKALLDAGASPNTAMTGGQGADGGETPLHSAINGSSPTGNSPDEQRLGVVELLLAAGADPNAVRGGDTTVIYEAASAGYLAIVKRLIEAGANVKKKVMGILPPLYGAANGRHESIARFLIECRTPIDWPAPNGMTPLLVAASRGAEGIVNLLIEKRADVNHKAKNGDTPLLRAAEFARSAFTEREHQVALRIVRVLLEHGADPTVRNNDGETVLQIASEATSPIVSDFIKSFAGKSARTIKSRTK